MRPPVLCVSLALFGCHGASTSSAPSDSNAPTATPRAVAERPDPAGVRPLGTDPGHAGDGTALAPGAGNELAAFAAGGFLGGEDTFRQVPGVVATAVGYAGGHTHHPSYQTLCSPSPGPPATALVQLAPERRRYATP